MTEPADWPNPLLPGQEMTLFSSVEIRLADRGIPEARERYREYFGNIPFSKHSAVIIKGSESKEKLAAPDYVTQLSFPFMDSRESTVIAFCPKRSHVYLDFALRDVFRDVSELHDIIKKLERRGVYLVGQLVQLSVEDLRTFSFMTKELISVIKAHLAEARLGLSMRAPQWNRRRAMQFRF